MKERLQNKLSAELQLIKSQKHLRIYLGLGFFFTLIGTLIRATFTNNELLTNLGILLGAVGSVMFVWGTIKYAHIKGRNIFSFLVVLFMPFTYLWFLVLFVLKPKIATEKIPCIPMMAKEYVLTLVSTLCLFTYSLIRLNVHFTYLGLDNYSNLIPMWLVVIVLPTVLILPVWALIKNKRKMLTATGWLMLLLFFLWLFIVPKDSAEEIYKVMRNQVYVYLLFYAILHLLIHGIYWIKSKKRSWVTPEGLFHWYWALIFTTFYYSVYDFVLKLI
ncbi:hypothetical protein IPM62_05510 [Candidatus Woesebacteria bacterium]|nr:MAG: hypothetical protein IPM62_05510 [Candidatus Woesebacteria bacterium]